MDLWKSVQVVATVPQGNGRNIQLLERVLTEKVPQIYFYFFSVRLKLKSRGGPLGKDNGLSGGTQCSSKKGTDVFKK